MPQQQQEKKSVFLAGCVCFCKLIKGHQYSNAFILIEKGFFAFNYDDSKIQFSKLSKWMFCIGLCVLKIRCKLHRNHNTFDLN